MISNPSKSRTPKKPKASEEIKSISDDYGNLLICKDNGKRVLLSLKLVSESKYRRIGVINRNQRNITIKRDRKKHLFLKGGGSYGFNHKMLVDSKAFDTIYLSDEVDNWKIPKSFILEKGKFLHFNDRAHGGFELQIFIKLEDINQFKQISKI